MLLVARKTLSFVFIGSALCGPLCAESQPANQFSPSYDTQGSFRRGLPKEQIAQLKREVTALQSEFEMLQERLNYQDNDLETIRQDLGQISFNSNQRGDQLVNLEAATNSLGQDVANACKDNERCQKILAQFQTQVRQVEKNVEIQGQNIRNLEKAVHALVELMQKSDRSSTPRVGLNSSVSTHTVREGDTLEKIARQHKTTIDAIKEANGLVSDRIVSGKKLKIPS